MDKGGRGGFGTSGRRGAITGVLLALAMGSLAAGADELPPGLTRGDWEQIRGSIGKTGDAPFLQVHEAQLFGRGDGEPGAQFGSAVAVSGDTVVVGAPSSDTSAGVNAGSVSVFVRSGSTWTEQQRLVASDAAANDAFGSAVAISGDTIVAGAFADDTAMGTDAGSAYVFVRAGTTWTQQQKLTASDGAGSDVFGISVSISGDTIAAGAYGDDISGNADAGSAYVFVRSGATWTQQQKLVGAANPDDQLGYSVAVSGDTVVAGAPLADVGGGSIMDAGAAVVFVRAGAVWTTQQTLVASDPVASDEFGIAVAVSGNTAVVGSVLDDTPGAETGSAYVFVRAGTSWSEQQKLVASDGAAGDAFGVSVSLSGDTAMIGAPGDDTGAALIVGSAYVFVRSGTTWTQQQKLVAADGAALDGYGSSVSLSGETAVAGVPGDDTPSGAGAGSARALVRAGTSWTEQQALRAAGAAIGDAFGYSVSVSGDTAVVGALNDDTTAGANAGSAYVFVRTGTTWTEQQKLTASDAAAGDAFGWSVSISGDTIVVGAATEDNASGLDAGSAYVFVRSGTTWTQQQKLVASDGAAGDAFALSVGISGNTIIAGAHLAVISGDRTGSAYVFVRSGTTWTQQQKLPALGGITDFFGWSVAVSGDTAIVGARLADAAGGTITDAGAAAVYVRAGTTWILQRALYASDPVDSDHFGASVSISGDTAVVGSVHDDTPAVETGSAYVFVRSGTTWTEQQKLVASDGANGDGFGGSVSLSGNTVVIGASADDAPGAVNAGSAYVFVRTGTTWSEQQKILAPAGAANDSFGVSVSLSGDTILIGTPGDDTPGGADAGSAHVFREGAAADVAVSILDSPDPVTPGANLVYTIVVTNNGPDAALGVEVSLPTPPGLTFLGNAGACTSAFPCALGTVPSGESRTITGTFRVGSGYAGPNPISGTTTATSATGDPVAANNQGTALTAVAPASADLAIAKVGPATVAAGSNVVYSITASNGGPSDAASVQVADPTPPGLTFVSTSGACTSTFPCALGTIAAGQSRVITATFDVPAGYSGPNPIVNQATVSAATADPVGANNTGGATTTVLFAASLEPAALAVDTAGDGVFQPNESVIVAPAWRNAGPTATAGVGGAASSFTGPAGPTYTIADGVAAYGTIGPGAIVGCTADCYLLANAASVRPAQHWDTTFLEMVAPPAASKAWTLHVGDSFSDVPASGGFYRFVETLLHHGVTGGCSATSYCPATATTREQMAVFVLVASEGRGYAPTACATPVFTDVPASSPFCRWIEELARRGVVGGCGGGNYCPVAAVTREQMAVFVLRTLDPASDPPPCVAPNLFADVPETSPFCRWIEALATLGVVGGCGGGNYCPLAPVTREQMGVFLGVTFDLTLYGL